MSRRKMIRTKPKQSTSKKEKDGIKPLNHYKMSKKEKILNQPNNSALHKTAVRRVRYERFIEKFPNSILVDKVFGDGNKLISIGFNEHRRIGLRYLVRVDSSVSVIDMHDLAEEIEDYLVEEFGMFERHEDFEEWCDENDYDISKCSSSCFCKIHSEIFDEWFIEQFPKVDISGGCSNWNDV